jgi:hypothetical protein
MTYLDQIAHAIRQAAQPDALPDDVTTDLFRLYAVLLLAKDSEVTHEDVHNAWVAWMLSKGEHHPSLVPFEELDAQTQAEDSPFMGAIREVARSRRRAR